MFLQADSDLFSPAAGKVFLQADSDPFSPAAGKVFLRQDPESVQKRRDWYC